MGWVYGCWAWAVLLFFRKKIGSSTLQLYLGGGSHCHFPPPGPRRFKLFLKNLGKRHPKRWGSQVPLRGEVPCFHGSHASNGQGGYPSHRPPSLARAVRSVWAPGRAHWKFITIDVYRFLGGTKQHLHHLSIKRMLRCVLSSGKKRRNLHAWSLFTWSLPPPEKWHAKCKVQHLKMYFLLRIVLFQLHVSFQRCNFKQISSLTCTTSHAPTVAAWYPERPRISETWRCVPSETAGFSTWSSPTMETHFSFLPSFLPSFLGVSYNIPLEWS